MTSMREARRRLGAVRLAAQDARLRRRMRHRLRAWQRAAPGAPGPHATTDLTTTVVVPCYNHAAFLPLAVESLLAQTLQRFDTVLVDDASTDHTGELLDDLAEALRVRGEVRVVRHARNAGQAASLNEGFEAATTPLLTVLNDDDWLTPSTLETMLAMHREHRDLAVVGSHSRWFAGAGRPPDEPVPDSGVRWFGPADLPRLRRPNDLNLTHSGMTVSREAWRAVGGYRTDPRTRVVPYSDRDLQLRIAAVAKVAVLDAPLVWWRSDSSVDAGVNS
jgi:GT2 family glycosyltransferase